MKLTKMLLVLFLLSTKLSAQWAQCDTMTITLITSQVKFVNNIFASSDSVVKLPFINNTSANFAYPQAKLINTTPLPPGMSLADASWQVFASAWNIGDTATASVGYNVTTTIPDNYTVTFKVYCKNFAPLAYDSCEFTNTITVNLKPVGPAGVSGVQVKSGFTFYPNPAQNVIAVCGTQSSSVLEIYSVTGALVKTAPVSQQAATVDISELAAGVYFLREKGASAVRKMVKRE